MASALPQALIRYFLRLVFIVFLLAFSHHLITDIQQASLQSQRLKSLSSELSRRIKKLDSIMNGRNDQERSLNWSTQQSFALYSIGRKVSYINDIVVRSQTNEPEAEQKDELDLTLLLPFEERIQQEEPIFRLLVSHLKEGKLDERKKKILDFCRNNPAGEAQIKDLLLHSSSLFISYFPDHAQSKIALQAAARYSERIGNQYRIKARPHEKLHFCVFIQVQNEQRRFSFASTLQSIIAQDYELMKIIIIEKGSSDHTLYLLHSFLKGQNISSSKFAILHRRKDETQAQYLFESIPLYCQADDIVIALQSGDEVIGRKSFLLVNQVLRGDVASMVQVNSLRSEPGEGPLSKQIASSLIRPNEARSNPQLIDHSFFFFKGAAFLKLKEADLRHEGLWLSGASAFIVPMVEMACSKLTFLGEFMILSHRKSGNGSYSAERIRHKQAHHCENRDD